MDPNAKPPDLELFEPSTNDGEHDGTASGTFESATDVVDCARCQKRVVPDRGRCPHCKSFLPGNQINRRHPVRVARVEEIHTQLLTDYAPHTVLHRTLARHLATVLERLELVSASGSVENTRLTAQARDLAAALEDARTARPASDPDLANLTPDELVARASSVLELARLAAEASKKPLSSAVEPPASEANGAPANPVCPGGADSASAPLPEPTCPFCRHPLGRCLDLQTTNLDTWRVLHAHDPAEVDRRAREATREMFESLRRFGPARY
jgi:hypothetical protein